MIDQNSIKAYVERVIAKSKNATYVTYNCGDKFDPEKFVEIKNSVVPTSRGLGLDSSKPRPKTGLWATYEDEDGYLKLCTEMGRSIKSSFKFKLSDDAKILHLFNKTDVEAAMDYYNEGVLTLINSYACLNFEAIAKDYDVIHYHLNDEICHPQFNYMLDGLYYALYGWDFDSILVMNKDVVVPLNRKEDLDMNMGNIKVLETRAEKLVRHLNDEITKLYKATDVSEALSSDNAAKLDAYTKIASVQFMVNKMSLEFSDKIQIIGAIEDKDVINRTLMELAQIINAVINKNPEIIELGIAEGARELAINMMSLICLIMADINDIYGMFEKDYIAPKSE